MPGSRHVPLPRGSLLLSVFVVASCTAGHPGSSRRAPVTSTASEPRRWRRGRTGPRSAFATLSLPGAWGDEPPFRRG